MREILFRAKRKNWRELPKEEWWAEGVPIEIKKKMYMAVGYVDSERITDFKMAQYILQKSFIEIVPETLCQFTGLVDKNGKRIWENDIVQTPFFRFVVTYSDGVWGDSRGNAMRESVFGEGGVVIGNIFDHPELLKGETE